MFVLKISAANERLTRRQKCPVREPATVLVQKNEHHVSRTRAFHLQQDSLAFCGRHFFPHVNRP